MCDSGASIELQRPRSAQPQLEDEQRTRRPHHRAGRSHRCSQTHPDVQPHPLAKANPDADHSLRGDRRHQPKNEPRTEDTDLVANPKPRERWATVIAARSSPRPVLARVSFRRRRRRPVLARPDRESGRPSREFGAQKGSWLMRELLLAAASRPVDLLVDHPGRWLVRCGF